MVSGSSDYKIKIWDVNEPGTIKKTLNGHTNHVSASDDTMIKIWNISTESLN